MKKLILTLATIAIATVSGFAQKIVIKGSDTVLPLSQKEAESYMKKTKCESVTLLAASGSRNRGPDGRNNRHRHVIAKL
jgi:ABC-type phosphate transport system substrate-binding protein